MGSFQFAGVGQLLESLGPRGNWIYDRTQTQIQIHEENCATETERAADRATASGCQQKGFVHPSCRSWPSSRPVFVNSTEGCDASNEDVVLLSCDMKIVQSEGLIAFSAENTLKLIKVRFSSTLDSIFFFKRTSGVNCWCWLLFGF